jgi:high-affinity iron transporter
MMVHRLLLLLTMLLPAMGLAQSKLDADTVIQDLVSQGDAAAEAYRPETGLDTMDSFSGLYFDVFEATGLEVAVGMKDPALKARVESLFGEVIGLAGQGAPKTKIVAAWVNLRADITGDVQALFADQDISFSGLAIAAGQAPSR